MLTTINNTVLALSKTPLAPLIFVDIYSLISINNNPVQTKTNLNATANPLQMFYQALLLIIYFLLQVCCHHQLLLFLL